MFNIRHISINSAQNPQPVVHLADALQTGDIHVAGAENFGDYRTQLLPWAACKSRLASYCVALGMPQTGKAFVTQLKEQLTAIAAEVDAGFPANSELTIDTEGVPHLKKQPAGTQPAGTQPAGTQPAGTQPAGTQPAGLAAFETEVHARMPERHLLDIIKYGACWTRYT